MYNVKTEIINNIPVVFIDTGKFKTMNLKVQFRSELTRERVSVRYLLSRMMVKKTGKFTTESEFLNHLAHLYGAHLTSNATKKGRDHLVSFNLEFINSRFVKEDLDLLGEMTSVLKDVLATPAEYGEADRQFFEREKRLYKSRLKGLRDNKAQKSFENLLNTMFEDESYKYLSHGVLEDIDDITLDDIKEEHQKMMAHDEAVILISGHLDEVGEEHLQAILSRDETVKLPYRGYDFKKPEFKTVTDSESVEQAKLNIGFRADAGNAEERIALNVINQMFGGSATSYLFKNIREKESLAYQIHSQADIKNGFLFVLAGVSPDQTAKAENAVMHELARIKKGDFTDEFVEETKHLMKVNRMEAVDKPKGLIALVYNQLLNGTTDEDWKRSMDAVVREMIVEVANRIHADTVYTLTGK